MKHLAKNQAHLFILDRGDKLFETLTPALERLGIRGGMISGLGALKDVALGYYELARQQYVRKTFPDDYELLRLNGNISVVPFDFAPERLLDESVGLALICRLTNP